MSDGDGVEIIQSFAYPADLLGAPAGAMIFLIVGHLGLAIIFFLVAFIIHVYTLMLAGALIAGASSIGWWFWLRRQYQKDRFVEHKWMAKYYKAANGSNPRFVRNTRGKTYIA